MNLAERQVEMKLRESKDARGLRKSRASSLHPATLKYRSNRVGEEESRSRKRRESEKFDSRAYDTQTPTDRRKVLLDWAEVLIEPITYEELQARRRSFDGVKSKKFPLFRLDTTVLIRPRRLAFSCWICREHDAVHRHHVVLLKNGGAVTARHNVVLLCEACHADIHPWMGVNPTKPVVYAEFELARVKREVNLLLDKAARGRIPSPDSVDVQVSSFIRNVFNTLVKK